MQISIKGYITSKKSELFYDCADRYAYNKSQHKFAISDGVSKSFFPKIWAEVLVNQWVCKKWNTDNEFIEYCQNDWLNQVTDIVNKPNVKWFTQNAFNRKEPGLATFVGLKFYEKKKDWYWKADAIGDSFLFFVPSKFIDSTKGCVVLSSKQEPIVFDNFPDYLSSLGNNHKGEKKLKENPLASGTFYLMTDALAEWFLKEKNSAISKINVWQNQKDFERFVDEERHNDKLGNDDSAILIITIEEDKKDKLTYVLEDVSDIDELIKFQQKEIEVSEKAKEQELILQKESSNSEIPIKQTKQEKPKQNKLSEKEEAEEIETDEKVKISEKHQKEEPSSQDEENKTEIEKSEDSEKNKNQEIKSKSNIEIESITKIPNKPSQNITDKF